MIKSLKNISKAIIAVAVTPLAATADILTMPASAERGDKHPFNRTAKVLTCAGDNISKAINPDT